MQQLTSKQLMILLYVTGNSSNGSQFDHMPNLLQDKSAVDALQKAKYVTCKYTELSLSGKFVLTIDATKQGQEYIKSILLPPEKS